MKIMTRIAKKASDWYDGRFIPPDNDPDSNVFFAQGHYERPLAARLISTLVHFHQAHWKWIWTTAAALAIAYFQSPWAP